jgi:hypothetical protein
LLLVHLVLCLQYTTLWLEVVLFIIQAISFVDKVSHLPVGTANKGLFGLSVSHKNCSLSTVTLTNGSSLRILLETSITTTYGHKGVAEYRKRGLKTACSTVLVADLFTPNKQVT